jgi:hypothetical protein
MFCLHPLSITPSLKLCGMRLPDVTRTLRLFAVKELSFDTLQTSQQLSFSLGNNAVRANVNHDLN